MPEDSSIDRLGDRLIRRYSFGSTERGLLTAVYSGMGGTDNEEDEADAEASDEGVGDADRDIGNGIAEGDAVELTSDSSRSMC